MLRITLKELRAFLATNRQMKHLTRVCVISVLATPLLSTLPAYTQSNSASTTDTVKQLSEASGAADNKKESLLTTEQSIDAQRERGEHLITGWGTKPNKEEGTKLLEAAIEKGDRKSLIVLGKLLTEGQFLKRDRHRALNLFERAAQMGDYEGIEALGENLMWNGTTANDRREAARLLSMAGEAGRGSAWTTLAYGAIYGKLAAAASAKYGVYLQKARALGSTEIEVAEAERLLYRTGIKSNAAKAIQVLVMASEKGNPDAIKYLIRLVRDGNGYNINRNLPKARAYLKSYGAKLSPELRQQQQFLLQVATAPPTSFASLSGAARAMPGYPTVDFQKQIFQANSNFSIYLAQEALKKKQLYQGPLNGRATNRTMNSLRQACNTLIWKADCDKKLMSDGAMAVIILF